MVSTYQPHLTEFEEFDRLRKMIAFYLSFSSFLQLLHFSQSGGKEYKFPVPPSALWLNE